MMNNCFIKCFETPKAQYFYDRHTDSVVRINNREEYEALVRVEERKTTVRDIEILEGYKRQGLLLDSVVNEIEHPEINNLCHLAENCMSQLILQVTQQCNLRCDYCTYSGKYFNRAHSSKRMTFETAKQAIDFFISRAGESKDLVVGFYGGEPLLEFELIRECVNYCNEISGDKGIIFNITTNGTLLTKEIRNFLATHKFRLTISLDGAKEEHDINRKFINGEGSFDVIMANLKLIKDEYEDYYRNNIFFNAVVNPKAKLSCVHEYFTTNELFLDGHVWLNSLATAGLKDKSIIDFNKKYWNPRSYEYLKILIAMIGRMKWEKTNSLIRSSEKKIEQLYRVIKEHNIESPKMHHGGPCIPGVRRLFVTTTGKFYPCERVKECIDGMCIGDLDNGFNYENMEMLMNHGKMTEAECLECWNLRRCALCLGEVDPIDNKITKEQKLKKCLGSRKETIDDLRELCVLVELGYVIAEEVK